VLFTVVITMKMAWAKHVSRMGIRNRIMLVGKPEERKPLARYRRGWDDNIKMELN
jgi:hypothetical protein